MDLCYFVSHNLGEYLVCSTLSETISTSLDITLNKLNPRSLKKRQLGKNGFATTSFYELKFSLIQSGVVITT